MSFIEYKFGCWKKEIRDLLRKRLLLKEKIWRHQNKIKHHEDKIKEIKTELLPKIENDLEIFLKKAGN